MRAITIQEFGPADGLRLSDEPDPIPGSGQVLIEVEAAGVAGFDAVLRRGDLQFPGVTIGHVPGLEVAGVVRVLGPDVDATWLNRRVWAFTGIGGGYAEQVVVVVADILPLDNALSSVDAVTIGASSPVAYFAIQHARVRTGEQVLVRGAAGSIGIAAVELAVRAGAIVTVTTSSSDRGERLRALGATYVLDRSGHGEAPDHFDVIIDIVGGAEVSRFIDRLRPNGRFVLVGILAGWPPAGFGEQLLHSFQKSLTFAAFSLDSIEPQAISTERAKLLRQAASGSLTAVVDDVLPLSAAAEAHRRIDDGEVFGRIVLTV